MPLSTADLTPHLPHLADAPAAGPVRLLVRRPSPRVREVMEEVVVDRDLGVVGDSWATRRNGRGRPADPAAQVTLMSWRMVGLLADTAAGQALAGDQVYLDCDLSLAGLPAGSRLHLGEVVLEISAKPHTGCAKFVQAFGTDAMRFVNSPRGRELRLRGVNARVVAGGRVRLGDLAGRA